MISPGYRALAWAGGGLVATIATGLAWLVQPVEVPLIGLLLLTFAPLETLNATLQDKIGGKSNG